MYSNRRRFRVFTEISVAEHNSDVGLSRRENMAVSRTRNEKNMQQKRYYRHYGLAADAIMQVKTFHRTYF